MPCEGWTLSLLLPSLHHLNGKIGDDAVAFLKLAQSWVCGSEMREVH
jgi:hypothetical protein